MVEGLLAVEVRSSLRALVFHFQTNEERIFHRLRMSSGFDVTLGIYGKAAVSIYQTSF